VKEILQFKRFVCPSDFKVIVLCQLESPIVLAQWKIIAVKDTPDIRKWTSLLPDLFLKANRFLDKALGIHPSADGFDDGAVAIDWKALEIKPRTLAILTNNEDAPAYRISSAGCLFRVALPRPAPYTHFSSRCLLGLSAQSPAPG